MNRDVPAKAMVGNLKSAVLHCIVGQRR